jgi:hypothetical protein
MSLMKKFAISIAVGFLCLPVMAQSTQPAEGGRRPGMQGGRQFPQLAPEKSKTAWETQAKRVSASIGLDEAKAGQVTKSYIEARQSFAEAVKAARDEARERSHGLGRAEAAKEEQRVTNDVRNYERDKLQTELAKTLDRDQLGKVMPLMGSFDVQWDFMVDALLDMKLEADNNTKAMDATEKFVLAMSKVRSGGGDFQALREANLEARRELDETLKPLLSQEQLEKFRTAMNFGRAMGERRGPGTPGGQGGRGGQGRGGENGEPGAAGGTGEDSDDGAPPPRRGGQGGRGGGASGGAAGGAGGTGGGKAGE